MKKRYLFPLLWLIAHVSIYIVPVIFPAVYILSMPSMLIVHIIALWLDAPADTTYFVISATYIQFFLLGLLWDFIVEKINAPFSRI